MTFKTFLFTLALIVVTGCSNTPPTYHTTPTVEPPPVTADGLVTCVSHLDRELDFTYHPDNANVWHSKEYDVHVYLIDTSDGEQIVINSLELENYECSKPALR